MIRFPFARRIALVLVTLALSAPAARAQCLITGPDLMCSGPVQLCGPQGDYAYGWRLPDGSSATTPCITGVVPGTYTLRVFDRVNGLWLGPCTHLVTLGDMGTTTCIITGATDGCVGDTLTLCGPAAQASYAWSGPGGFSDTASCVRVTAAGTYQLVADDGSGCTFGLCAATVTFHSCVTRTTCPRPPSFFGGACGRRGGGRLDASQLAAIASCVNDHSAAFDWTDPRAGFCAALRGDIDGPRDRARRQVAAVWANLCASDLGIAPAQGQPVVLDAATPVDLAPLYTGTVGEWLAQADAQLMALEGRRSRDRATRDAYHRIVRVGWMIDHGLGIGPTCFESDGMQMPAADDALPVIDGESLAAELTDVASPGLAMGRPNPNPFSSAMTLDYAVDGAGGAEVRIGVYDVAGRLVRTLVSGVQAPGDYQARWDGRDEQGASVRDGVYFVVGHLGGQRTQTRVTMLH